MAGKKSSKPHQLKRLSMKPLRLKEALKIALSTSLDDLKRVEEQERRPVKSERPKLSP